MPCAAQAMGSFPDALDAPISFESTRVSVPRRSFRWKANFAITMYARQIRNSYRNATRFG